MGDVAIRVEGLSKRYRIGRRARYQALRDAIADTVRTPFRWLKALAWGYGDHEPDRAAPPYIWALRDISFEVKRGEVVGIIGLNGAGKTTLLKILSRITEPTEGRAEVYGRVGSLLEVGTGFHPELTGRENIFLNGAIIGMKRADIEQKFGAIVSFAEVEPFIDMPVKHYSSGMYTRLAFSVAAHLEPEILLVDEVLAVGDAAFQEKCMGRMSEVSGQGRTVLFVSHNLKAVLKLCDRVLWLSQGRVMLDGDPAGVAEAYQKSIRELQGAVAKGLSLDGHPGRFKALDGVVRLTYCRVSPEEGNGAVASGRGCRIILGYRSAFPLAGASVNFVVFFRGESSQRIASCWSQIGSADLGGLDTAGEAECYIPRLPLAPGRYVIDAGCQVGSGWSDMVYEATTLYVVGGPFYPSGRLPGSEAGEFLMDYTWSKR